MNNFKDAGREADRPVDGRWEATVKHSYWIVPGFMGIVLLLLVSAAGASIVIYPGNAPCNSTLQACIDSADPGDVIQTDANSIDENISINKSLTLMPAPGRLHVSIGGGSTTRVINIGAGPSGETVKVTLAQLLIDPGVIDIGLYSGTGHEVTLRDCLVTAFTGLTGTRGIWMDVRTSANINIERSLIQTDGYPIYFGTLGNPGDVISLSVTGNRITGINSPFSSAGIIVDLRGAGTAQASIRSNVIWDVAFCNCGNPTALEVFSMDTVIGYVDIGNNTIDHAGGPGILAVGALGTSVQQVYINNNIVTNSTMGIRLPLSNPNVSISHNYNDFFGNTGANTYGGYPPGPQTFSFDPLNADQGYGYYALQTNSPAIDAGNASAPTGVSLYDSTLKPRIFGSNVDLGALESSFVNGSEYMILAEEFGSLMLPAGFTYLKGAWIADAFSLISSGGKAAFLASPAFPGCATCRIETLLKTPGEANSGLPSKMFVQGWYSDKNNLVELIVKEGSDKLLLRQKVNGTIVNKTKVTAGLNPFDEYRLRMLYDGVNFLVYLNGVPVITMPAAGSPFGTFGFQSKGAPGYIENVYVHY